MLRRCSYFPLLIVLLLVAACSSAPRNQGPSRVTPPAPKGQPSPRPADEATTRLAAGEFAVQVISEPAGGIVVLNGIPIGRTPQRVVLPGTSRGFLREAVSIKVRFVAGDTDHTSQTVEEVLTPLDKIPAGIRFTLAGVTRLVR